MDNLQRLFTTLLIVAGGWFMISGLSSGWLSNGLAAAVIVSAPFVGSWLANHLNGLPDAEPVTFKNTAKPTEQEREAIGFQYFKSVFLFAGHISAADGQICANEEKLLDEMFSRLHLGKPQVKAATEYFHQGRNPHFDAAIALDEFISHCGHIQGLCESFLETQFSFAEASEQVTLPEFNIIETISNRLNCHQRFNTLLEEHRQNAHLHAEAAAQAAVDARKRERDKKRFEAEQAKLNEKLSPTERKVRLALAILGLTGKVSITDIKRAYRKQIKRHHPDHLLAQGYPAELLDEATERSAKINQAYKFLKKHYQFR